MGTDIHAIIQAKKKDKWETIFIPKLSRSYLLFAVLADIRNGFGFAGCYTHDPIKPISEPRGLPEDLQIFAGNFIKLKNGKTMWLGDHSHSWLLLNEINDYDWDQQLVQGGFISPEIQKTYVSGTVPDGWCGGTTGKKYKEVKWTQTIRSAVNLQLLGLIDYYHGGYEYELDELRLVFGFDS